jgi:hypothetical protein
LVQLRDRFVRNGGIIGHKYPYKIKPSVSLRRQKVQVLLSILSGNGRLIGIEGINKRAGEVSCP